MEDWADPPAAEGETPIILGEAPPSENEFAVPPEEFVGTIDETAPPAEDAPIILGAPDEDAAAPAQVDDDLALMATPPIVHSGPSPMQKWNEEWQAILMERKDAENARKAEHLAEAEAFLKTFQEQRESKRDAKMAKNRADEQEKLEAIEADLENDNSWQRVCKMVELQHDSAHEGADVKRMRDVMILLKNEPSRATVLA